MNLAPHSQRLAMLALGAVFASCSGGSGHKVIVSEPVFLEAEPNDFVDQADFFGHLFPGDHLHVEGAISNLFFDERDGFAFVADVPCEVELVLHHDFTGDLDLRVYDPYLDEFVAYFETNHNPEVGSVAIFDAGVEFHVVVLPFAGFGSYDLEVNVYPLHAATAAPSDASPAGSIRAEGFEAPTRGAKGDAHERYFDRRQETVVADEPVPIGALVEIDAETGEVTTRLITRRVDGRVE